MNQEQADLEPPMSLPKPKGEQVSGGETSNVVSEQLASQSVEMGQSASSQLADPGGNQQAFTTSVANPQPSISPINVSITSSPAIADDVDLIEKEWVTKAKDIVEQTKGDPYSQNIEMNRVKADYLKKRYNKDLKQEDE